MELFLQPKLHWPEKDDSKREAHKMAGTAASDNVSAGTESLSLGSLQQALQAAMNEVESKFSKSVETAISPVLQHLPEIHSS